jgi:hypothetical protein
MSDIFISWGGEADRGPVQELTSRLEEAGLSVFEYSRSMLPGDVIDITVMHEIDAAKVAIVCISDTSMPREWVKNEIAWLHHARHQDRGLLRAIIPVQTGVLDENTIPGLLANTSIYHFEIGARSRESTLDDLMRAVHKNLGKPAPILFPAVILAMNAQQFPMLGTVMPPEQAHVCAHLAAAVNAFPNAFAQRYGLDALDFRPFAPDRPVVEVIKAAIREQNRARVVRNEPVLILKWMNSDLWSADPDRQQRAGATLRSNSRLLIVDSLSMHHPEIRNMLNDIPDLAPDRTGLVWVPPYSHWTRQLEDQILQATLATSRIRFLFQDWIRSDWGAERAFWRTFDIGTPASLWNWIYWMSDALAETGPQQPKVDQMQARFPAPGITPQKAIG